MPSSPSPFDLTDKVCVVTGATSGIGTSIAQALAASGATVAIWGRDESRLESVTADIVQGGGSAVAVSGDISSEESVSQAFARTLSLVGTVHACFANAGIAAITPSTVELETAEWRRVLATNLDGAFFTLRAAAAHMVEAGVRGSLVATSSRIAASGQARAPHYSASKGGLESLVRSLAVELGPHGIRANILSPGWIETPMSSPVISKDRVKANVIPRIPLGRFGRPDDFAGVAVYLASDASVYHTGDTLVIDGGYRLS